MNKVLLGDCLELMKDIPSGSIDMILCDLPYGTTACKWDEVIPFEPLWEQYERVVKDDGAIVLFGSEPFSSYLRMSNIKKFRYDWIWDKNRPSGHLNAKKMPLKSHEIISVFYSKQPIYNRQKTKAPEHLIDKRKTINNGVIKEGSYVNGSKGFVDVRVKDDGMRNPRSVQSFKCERGLHPTQKPVHLFEYLIKTYTNEGETVLDNCAGSGTTAIAALNTKRNYICIEKEKEYYDIINNRIEQRIKEKAEMLELC